MKNEMLSPKEQRRYILLDTKNKNYKVCCGWEAGVILRRISIWYSGRGCGYRQAYFVPDDSIDSYGQIAWEDHVKEITGQLELDI
jgi:hypothetical protein